MKFLKKFFTSKILISIHNAGFSLLDKLVVVAASMVCSAMAARSLGSEGFGVLQYCASLAIVLGGVSYTASSERFSREFLAQKTCQNRNEKMDQYVSVRLILGSVAAFIYISIAQSLGATQITFPLVVIYACTLIFSEPFAAYRSSLELSLMSRRILAPRIVGAGVRVVVCLCAYLFFGRIEVFALALLVDGLLSGSLFYFAAKAVGVVDRAPRFRPVDWRWIRAGLPLMFALLSFSLLQRADRIILPKIIGAGDYGQYTAALSLVDAITMCLTVASSALSISWVYRAESDLSATRGMAALAIFVLFAAGFVAALTSILSRELVMVIFGEKFLGSVAILKWGVLISVFAALEAALGALLVRQGLYFLMLFKYAVSLVVAVSIMMLAVPIYGVWAAVIGMVAGYFVAAVFNSIHAGCQWTRLRASVKGGARV